MTSREHKRRFLFREVNAKISEIDASFGAGAATYYVLCECGTDGCLQRLEVPVAVYDEVRGREGLFVVASGHEPQSHDRVVAEGPAYRVVSSEASPRRGAERRITGLAPDLTCPAAEPGVG